MLMEFLIWIVCIHKTAQNTHKMLRIRDDGFYLEKTVKILFH